MWQDHEAAQSYWQQKLAGFAAPTPIPIALHGQQNTVYHEAQLTLSLEQTQELNQFARGQRVTLNTLLQSTWAILLGRYSGESDIVFGATVSGRNVPISGIEQMVGLFINTLPLRANLSQDIKTLLHAMQNQQQQDNRYAYSNLANIQNWSEVPNGVALFDSIIVFENYPVDDALQDEQNLPFQINEFHGIEQTNYLLTMAVQPGKTLCFKLGFDHNRIYPQTGERLLEHFQNLLLGIVRNPETDIHSLPLRTETETRQLIQWNQTKSDYPKNKTIVDLFEAQAAKNPDKIAVVFEEQELTYVELNQQANRLSHYLHTLKDTNNGSLITDNCLIAICVERSPEMIVGLLGILKTGGAYVPLDPDYPQERLSYMLDDSRVRVLLTQRHLKNRLPALSAKTLELDTPKVFQQQPLSNPIQRSKADDLAYVIYTSGSTGQPKGVMVTHRNLSNAYFAWHEIYQLDSISSHLQMANFAFDVFTGDWVRALGSGGKLVLCPRNVLTEPDKLFALMEREHIDCAEFVPAVMRGLLEYLQVSRQQLNNMKCCIVGSDLWHYAEYRQLTQCCGKNTKVCNSYGVTECTIDSSYYEAKLSQQIADVTLSVPIGHPFPNTQIHILNVTHQSQPIGIPGELCIAGAGLAHGYLNRPELTAEKFIEIELFGEKQKIYKTGDLARWLPDGNLEYLGRLDHQVKLRGFRIELGEIEAVLTQHETVKEAVVVLHEREGHQVLAAYITMGYSELSIDFRGWLKGKLPDYMIPTHFMVLDKLPLTPNGKINRKALPEPEVRNTTEAIPPRNETESLLANLWSAVLKIEIKSISADFFDLGGHSLLATQLMSRIRDSFSIDMPLRTLFERPVLSDLAAWLDQQQRGITLPPIEPQVTNEPLVLSYAQQRLWFLAQLEGPGATYNIPAALELRGMLDIHALETTFVTLVQRHQSLRLCFPEVNGEATVQEIPAYNPLTVSELNHLSSDDQHVEVQRLAKEHAAASFDLANGPLLWLYLLTLSEQNAVLLFNMHHIISDGWSMDILVREWFDIYSALSQGQTPYLEPLPIQYSDYAAWQRSWLQGEVLQTQIEYWSKQLADAPQTLDLPTDKTRPDQLTYRGAEVSFQIDKTLTQSFKAFSQQQGCTLFMSLLAVYGILLSRYSRQKDILIATPIAGRHHTQLENIIGFFVNNLIIRVRPSNALNFSELLAQVRQTLLEAYAHQDLPFEKLVETLNIPRRQNYSPLSQAAFTMETADFSEPQLPSLHITSLPGISSVAKTDLTLSLVEHEDHLQGVVNYSTDLFIEATAIHFAKDFQALLTLLLEHPQQTLRRTLKNSGIHAQSSVQAGDMTWLLEHSNLTPNQLLIWLGQQVKSNEAVLYQSSLLSHLPFVVSLKHFQSALDTLLNSSDALRSVFLENGGIPRQQVLQALNYQVEWVDLSNGDNPQHALQTWAVRRNAKILTLSEQLFDIALIKLSAEHSIFYLNIHQLIGDGVAIDIIISQMSQLYQLAETGQLPGQVDFPQFATYQEDNESYLDSDRFKQDEAYWQQHARSVPLSFYGWHRRPRSNRVHCVHYQITALEMQRLHERAGQFAGTKQVNHTQLMLLFNTILVVYLHKISQNAEIVIGIPMHNRRTPAFKQTIGSFMQVLPMRVEVEPNDTFITLYRKVKQAHQPLLRHGRYALRNPAQNPLYEVTLNYHIASYDEFAGYPVTPDWQRATYSSELLTLNIFDFARSGQPHLEFDLNSEIFGKIECQYVIEHFQLVLAALLNNPEQPITTVSLLTSTARQQLIQWNQTHIDYPQDISIVELFEKQAVNTPDRLAVVFGDDQLSYRMLNQRANQLARELMAFGVKTDTLVGICVERSLEMIIGLLGILKAGGAYVPLDPNYPQERLSYMLDDSKVSLLLTQSRLQDKLPTTEALIVYLDAPSVFEKQPSDNPNSVYGLENLAYVIYTSGSTGKPKGVMITHQSLSHFVQAGSEKLYNISADDKVLQFASFTFDASVEEIYLALTKGATLILRSPDMLDTNEGFLRLCASWQITVLDLPTAFWQQLLHEENLELLWPDTIRLVIIGGEAASQSVTENWMQRLSHRATLINTYGPTEATVVATAFTVDNTYESLPIGKPIPNVQIHILDTNHQPQPVGIPAELCIAGAGLARGYLNRPELTAEKFIEIELFGKKQRVYKTGDLARWLPDGNLEYLGRIDHQVKLRGFRIELGEIESVLTLHEAVVEAVVVLYEQKDNKALAAYITTHNDELSIDNSPFITSLRAWLKDTLPDYMVPTHFTVLDKLPLTPNGKIDRNALPEPDVLQTGEIIAPQSEIEIELAKLWSTLLNIEINSITAHFFDLGGHSLLATRLVSRIRDDLGVNLPLRVLFEYPVLQDLAHYIELQQPIFLNNPLQEDEEEFEL
jgi:amino acid adenylation domain-containing protein